MKRIYVFFVLVLICGVVIFPARSRAQTDPFVYIVSYDTQTSVPFTGFPLFTGIGSASHSPLTLPLDTIVSTPGPFQAGGARLSLFVSQAQDPSILRVPFASIDQFAPPNINVSGVPSFTPGLAQIVLPGAGLGSINFSIIMSFLNSIFTSFPSLPGFLTERFYIRVPQDEPTLQQAVYAIAHGGTIEITQDIQESVILDEFKGYTIKGSDPDITITAASVNDTVLDIINGKGNITIRDLTIVDGAVGIFMYSSIPVTLDQVSVKRNVYGIQVVENPGQTQRLLFIRDSDICRNIDYGLIASQASLLVSNCRFYLNGINFKAFDRTGLYLEDSWIALSKDYFGAIVEDAPNVSIRDSIFTFNQGRGGLIVDAADRGDIVGSQFCLNRGSGLIINQSENVVVENCTFSLNVKAIDVDTCSVSGDHPDEPDCPTCDTPGGDTGTERPSDDTPTTNIPFMDHPLTDLLLSYVPDIIFINLNCPPQDTPDIMGPGCFVRDSQHIVVTGSAFEENWYAGLIVQDSMDVNLEGSFFMGNHFTAVTGTGSEITMNDLYAQDNHVASVFSLQGSMRILNSIVENSRPDTYQLIGDDPEAYGYGIRSDTDNECVIISNVITNAPGLSPRPLGGISMEAATSGTIEGNTIRYIRYGVILGQGTHIENVGPNETTEEHIRVNNTITDYDVQDVWWGHSSDIPAPEPIAPSIP